MRIDYESRLNPAQLEAVTAGDGPQLVIAGAGSGKTRTIVYRLAWLLDHGVPAGNILLLTFTRKAARQMIERAETLLGSALPGLMGGTFHGYAYSVLRRYPAPGQDRESTIMDRSDAEGVIKGLKTELGLGKGDRSFPKSGTVLELLSKSRNKEVDLPALLFRESFHLTAYAEDLARIDDAYVKAKRKANLLDYDDLLFELERMFRERPEVLEAQRERMRYLMVDEYQDTNLVQARLVRLLAGERQNVMAVGDDAQSIYAFRGADVRNILDFRESFPKARIVKLEQNYRSTQPILDLTNKLLEGAPGQYQKNLFTTREEGDKPILVRPLSDLTQARLVADAVLELMGRFRPSEVAVLFRAGYQSYPVEVELTKRGVKFKKYGGLRYTEAAHVKDVLSFVRLTLNPSDLPAWQRALSHVPKVGPKTAQQIYQAVVTGDREALSKLLGRNRELSALFRDLESLQRVSRKPLALIEAIMAFYRPILERGYPDDFPQRLAGLEELMQIASGYEEADLFLTDLSLENPEPRGPEDAEPGESVVLSTIHSAKGLEWSAVLIIDLVEERFPSRHALAKQEDFEEERRLFYVACTRARDHLRLFMPSSIYRRGIEATEPAMASPFLRELDPRLMVERRESLSGGLCDPSAQVQPMSAPRTEEGPPPSRFSASGGKSFPPASTAASGSPSAPGKSGPLPFCKHKIFGRGKIVADLGGNKFRVNFPGFGLKVIIGDYLELEE